MKSSVMPVCCWQSPLQIWFIALGRWPRPVPQRCEVLSSDSSIDLEYSKWDRR